jgi:hypothetical protein
VGKPASGGFLFLRGSCQVFTKFNFLQKQTEFLAQNIIFTSGKQISYRRTKIQPRIHG